LFSVFEDFSVPSYYLREVAIHSFVLGFDDTKSGGGMQERVRGLFGARD
jgi:hypothetical protein